MSSEPAVAEDASPWVEELSSSLLPWDAFERLRELPYVLFLDSSSPANGSHRCRYSFITADPFEFVTGKALHLAAAPSPGQRPVLSDLKKALQRFRLAHIPDLPPFQGGLAGVFSYDFSRHLENLPEPAHDAFKLPAFSLGLYDWVLAFDHQLGRCWIISTGFPELNKDRRLQRAETRAEEVKHRLLRSSSFFSSSPAAGAALRLSDFVAQYPVKGFPRLLSNFDRTQYLETIARAIEYIYAGDIFQVNIAQRLLLPVHLPPSELYLKLRSLNPAAFGGYFDARDYVLASVSPEQFLQVRDQQVVTCPIKGTRPRGYVPAEDLAQKDALKNSTKDRAENLMIVDLLRNDLSRVCIPGTVQVPDLFRIETIPFVHHLVSTVRGTLEEGAQPLDLLGAAFPGGSITGAPKIRAMEIIAELERTARGPYCGSLGYVSFSGRMDTNIIIRSLVLARGWAQLAVGGGIVAQSVPEREYEETMHKAEGLLRALY